MRLAWLLLALGAFPLGLGAAPLRLIRSSPFLGETAVVAPGNAPAPLVFEGIMRTAGGTRFCIRDSSHPHEVAWVALNESGHPFVVRSYDAGRDVITLDDDGQTLYLSLRRSRTAGGGALTVVPPAGVMPSLADAVPSSHVGALATVTDPWAREQIAANRERIARLRAANQAGRAPGS